jgi:hypothetical protein
VRPRAPRREGRGAWVHQMRSTGHARGEERASTTLEEHVRGRSDGDEEEREGGMDNAGRRRASLRVDAGRRRAIEGGASSAGRTSCMYHYRFLSPISVVVLKV